MPSTRSPLWEKREAMERAVEAQGLLCLGFVPLGEQSQAYARFQAWLAQGKHGDMTFLERHGHLRRDPRGLLEGAQTALLLALPYQQGDKQ